MGIGARLKEAREEKSISLESLQETTKIQKRYLRAIEEENFSVLPGKFYARAFIKEYALAVNLNVDELFEEYKDDLPQTEDQGSTEYTRIQQSRKESKLSKDSAVFSIIPTIIVVLLITGVIFAVWFFMFASPTPEEEINQAENDSNSEELDYGDSDTETNDDEDDDVTGEEDDAEVEATEDEESDQDLELALTEDTSSSNPDSTFDLKNVEDNVTLTLDSSGETWLEVEDQDGEKLYYGTLTPDDSPLDLEVEPDTQLYFSIGNASVLDIKFNELEFEYPKDPSQNVVQKVWINIK